MGRDARRGSVLISSYLILSLFLVYSNAISQQTLSQRLSTERLRQRFQAVDLCHASFDQLIHDLHQFLTVEVYQVKYQGNAVNALAWLDALGKDPTAVRPLFDMADVNKDGKIDVGEGDRTPHATPTNPITVTGLPSMSTAGDFAKAWIVDVKRRPEDINDPLAARYVTMQAQAQVGGTTKTLQATYEFRLGMSDIFRYAYFVNNYGWIDRHGDLIQINGEVRSNGDFTFTGAGKNSWDLAYVQGDIYASANPRLNNPITGVPSKGTITGDPYQFDDNYWRTFNAPTARPPRQLVADGQPPIGGKQEILPPGYGWDSRYINPKTGNPDQHFYASQPTQPIPYLGDLSLYKGLATTKTITWVDTKGVTRTQTGGTLTYTDITTGQRKTINGIYYGPDGIQGTADDNDPLVLNGDAGIFEVHGPVVIPGDVIVRGFSNGRGTIYAGRNIHVVGSTTYWNETEWNEIERNTSNGDVRTRWSQWQLGRVCDNGTYFTQAEVGLGAVCK